MQSARIESRRAAHCAAILFCTAVEFLQLTEIPAQATALVPPAALVLGAGFDQRDLLVYAFAVVGAMLLDVLISRLLRRRALRTP